MPYVLELKLGFGLLEEGEGGWRFAGQKTAFYLKITERVRGREGFRNHSKQMRNPGLFSCPFGFGARRTVTNIIGSFL
jgi:hypothetical protein